MIRRSFSMSIANIKGNKMRSFLTMLGIIIGVAAVISLVTMVSSVRDYMMNQFASMGAGTLTISIIGTPMKRGLSETDLNDIANVDNVASVSPSVSVLTKVVRNGYVSDEVSVNGKSEEYFRHNGNISLGRALLPSDMDGTVDVCVIDQKAARKFFPGENPIGQTIRIGGITYRVIGMSAADNNLMTSIQGGSGDDGSIFIPYRNALTMNGSNAITSLEVYAADSNLMDDTANDVKKLLRSSFNNNEDAYMVINMDSLVNTMNTMSGMLSTMLGGIAAISLLVGGIGIMNMMLVSVTERTKEIGLRKALGAKPATIQLQFLLESIILSVIGGLIGIAVGEIIAYAGMQLLKTQYSFNIGAAALGFFFSLAVGIIFGWAPARNASRLNPIDALRSE